MSLSHQHAIESRSTTKNGSENGEKNPEWISSSVNCTKADEGVVSKMKMTTSIVPLHCRYVWSSLNNFLGSFFLGSTQQ